MPLYAPQAPVATVNPFMAQVLIDPTVVGRNGNLVVFRRKPKRLSVRRQLNDGPVLQSFAQWETIVGSVIQAAGSVGSAAVSAALAPRYQQAQAPPPVQQPTTLLAPQVVTQAPPQAQTQVNQSIAGQETTPAHYQVSSPAGFNLASLESNPTLLIAGGAAFILLLVLLMKK